MLILKIIEGSIVNFLSFFRDLKKGEFGRVLWIFEEEIFGFGVDDGAMEGFLEVFFMMKQSIFFHLYSFYFILYDYLNGKLT